MKKVILLLALITLVVYFNTLNHSFVWDDQLTITNNDLITHVKHIPKIFVTNLYHSHAEKTTVEHSNYYRPIQTITFLIDYHIWKLDPYGFHLTNVLLHFMNGVLVFVAVFLICKSRIVSLFTSILFLVHPVQTGAVAYLTGRSDVLACFFLLISFILYVGYCSITPWDCGGDGRKRLFYPLSLAAFILALGSKEVAIIFPLALIFYDVAFTKNNKLFPERNKPFSRLKRYSAYFFIDAVYIALRLSVLNFTPEKTMFKGAVNMYNQLLTMSHTLMGYIGLLLYPVNLHMERQVSLASSVFTGGIALSLAGIACFIFLSFVCYKRSRAIFFGIMWFIIFLLPFTNVVAINAMMAEHWLYIPSIGFFLALSILFLKVRSIRINYNFILALFVFLASFYSYKAIARNRDWKDDLSIYFATLKYSPRKAKMYYNIGTIYSSRGSFEEAAKFYNLAIADGLEKPEPYTNLALAYMKLGRLEESEENFKKALTLDPNEPYAHNGLGGLFEITGSIDKAILQYKRALECHSNFYDPHVNLGALYDGQKRFGEAIYHFEKALSIRNDFTSYYNLGHAYHRAGDIKKARQIWKEGRVEVDIPPEPSKE